MKNFSDRVISKSLVRFVQKLPQTAASSPPRLRRLLCHPVHLSWKRKVAKATNVTAVRVLDGGEEMKVRRRGRIRDDRGRARKRLI